MKCCANCEWSISPQLEDAILEEQSYDEDDPNRPHAGDCCIGMKPDKNYCCPEHLYIDGMEEYETTVLYDEKYYGKGYLIVTTLDDEVIKFIKISSSGEKGLPVFAIRGYEKNSVDNPNDEYRKINLTVEDDNSLYNVIYRLSHSLHGKIIYGIDEIEHGKNNLQANHTLSEATITLSKDVYGVKHATGFIDILIGDNCSCKYYKEFFEFYSELSNLSIGQTKDEDIKKLIK